MNAPIDDLTAAAQWWTRLADVLADAGRRLGRLVEQIGHDWPDEHGRAWAERTATVRAEVGREAVVAAEVGADYARRSLDAVIGWGPAGRRPGVRLGGTEAQRVDEERGMRIAELPDPPRS